MNKFAPWVEAKGMKFLPCLKSHGSAWLIWCYSVVVYKHFCALLSALLCDAWQQAAQVKLCRGQTRALDGDFFFFFGKQASASDNPRKLQNYRK